MRDLLRHLFRRRHRVIRYSGLPGISEGFDYCNVCCHQGALRDTCLGPDEGRRWREAEHAWWADFRAHLAAGEKPPREF